MNLNIEQVNALPVRTWSWLGINDRTIEEEIPEILPYKKDPLITKDINNEKDILFTINNGSGYKVELDNVAADTDKNSNVNYKDMNNSIYYTDVSNNMKSKYLESTKEKVSSIPTGMGENTANYIKNNNNTGLFIRIPSGKKYKEPIFLEYDLDEENKTVVDLNTIYAEEDSEVTVVMHYKSKKGISAFHSGLTYLFAEKNAIINLLQIQLLSEDTLHLNDIGAVIENGGVINLVHTELGGSKAYNGCKADLKGSNSKINIETIYFGDKNRSIDMNYVMNHYGKNSNSQIHVNGALLDQSSKTFRGTIDFKKGAAGSIGQEEEYNLLFSPQIRNLTAPLILCEEENVEGKHGANSGKIDENKLFYMMSRGLDELSAKKLMIEAAFRPAMEQIPFTNLQDQISEYVKERLNNIESI
ncbi:MAG: Fe-S cluster assembly protein SufD [Anaerocolumna aminovalerica]|uniref:Fe-S cluster assembly protein SufD n=1 Tax=Anaerocolumna aminovalerica TaxID=1527 RepID=UPI00290A35E9|nr:Fe-S cluster assembly protein SufD [Anaerocolumna aminovalerica]MDU6265405.1 Fe-S cluster assembly protein SufD [Anaerocolumna aminovalerica]